MFFNHLNAWFHRTCAAFRWIGLIGGGARDHGLKPPPAPHEDAKAWYNREIGDHLSRRADYSKFQHQVALSTNELIELSAYCHFEAENYHLWAESMGIGVKSRDYWYEVETLSRRDAINNLLDEISVAQARARGEERLRKEWDLSIEEWRVYRCGSLHKWMDLVARRARRANGMPENEVAYTGP